MSEDQVDGAAIDGPGVADARADAGFDAGANTFCGGQTGALFCQDFDTGTLVEQGWVVTTTPGANLTLISSQRSTPFALEARTPQSDGASASEARVTRSMDLPVTAQTVRLAFDVEFVQRDGALLPKMAVAFNTDGYEVDLFSNGVSETYVLVYSPDGFQQAFDSVPLGTFARYELTLTRSGTTLVLGVTRDGAPIANGADVATPAPAPAPGATWTLQMGAMNTSSNGPCTFVFDNVLITAS